MRRLLEQNPINAWTGGRGTGSTAYFAYEEGRFRSLVDVGEDQREAFQSMVRELTEWRLAEYLDRAMRQSFEEQVIPCKVSHSGGRPIIFLPDRTSNPQIPTGSTPVDVDGKVFELDFVKVAVNVARAEDGGENELPRILRAWFGPDAGRPGTNHRVLFELKDDGWTLRPEGRREGELQLWRSYSREQIPPLFGMEFSKAIWNVGYVNRSGHIVLMVTLDKSGHGSDFQYGDRFLSPSLFEWQSQNRTSRDSRDGKAIWGHVEKGIPVHLFVRPTKKVGSRAAPFVYCGDVVFEDWEGDRPVTVRWRLPEEVPEGLRGRLRVVTG